MPCTHRLPGVRFDLMRFSTWMFVLITMLPDSRFLCLSRHILFFLYRWYVRKLLIQDIGFDSVALATLVMEGALGKDGADSDLNDAYHW